MSETAKILLVDDEPAMLRYIRTLLEVDNHKVETASTGEEAVAMIQKGLHPKLLGAAAFLMPGIDGLQTLEQLRKIQGDIKVVMLSCVSEYAQSGTGHSSRSTRLPDQAVSESRA